MSDLTRKKCVPCQSGTQPLKGEALKELSLQLEEGWKLVDEHHLERLYKFKNFKEALQFVDDVGHLAEEEGHHPDIELSWGKVKLCYLTHKIGGLSESDFVMAAKSDACFISRHSS